MHRERPFFKDLVDFMISGPVMIQVLEGDNAIAKNRELMGATDPKKAAPGTIRADFAQSIDANAVHGSDAPETADGRNRLLLSGAEHLQPLGAVHGLRLDDQPARLRPGRRSPRSSPSAARSRFARKQVLRWIHQRCVDRRRRDERPRRRRLRETLARDAEIARPAVVRDTTAADGTRKWLLDVGNGNAIEAVYIPEDDRGTLCVSSQAGCALDCAFCSTGKQGFNRNLTVGEIIGQLWHANRALLADGIAAPWVEHGRAPITNVVMMGMGEPLANFDNVVAALQIMLDDNAYGLSRRRVTLSTSGLVPAIDRLRDDCPVALAVSAARAERRAARPPRADQPQISAAPSCWRRACAIIETAPRDFVTFEYVMLDGVNDGAEHARELVALVRDVPCKFNLIPFNPFPEHRVQHQLAHADPGVPARSCSDAGLVATIRKTRGDDIDAACGQLAGQVQDRTRRTLRRIQPVAAQ